MFTRKLCCVGLMAIPFLLAACTTPKTAVQRRADHMAYQVAQLDFDPNVSTQIANTARNSAKFLQNFYDEGKRARAAGLTPEQAKEQTHILRDPSVLPAESQQYTLVNRQYSVDNPQKQREIAVDAAIATFMDGYNGVL